MKRPIALMLGIAIGSAEEAAEFTEKIVPQPHIESETYGSPQATVMAAAGTGSSADTTEPLAHLRWRIFYGKMLRARKAGEFGMLNAFADTACELAKLRPNLKSWERKMQAQMLDHEIQMIKMRSRGCKDYSSALPAIEHALGI